MTAQLAKSHPAAYSSAVLDAANMILAPLIEHTFDQGGETVRVLDPMAGIGRVHQLARPGVETVGVELEPEWAGQHPGNIVGDATRLPFDDWTFHAIVVSPAFGNRMADQYDGRDGSKRHTYRIALGRQLSDNSGAALQWGRDYRALHRAAWAESVRVLKPGGLFVLNCKDHVRQGKVQRVTDWHIATLRGLGLRPIAQWWVDGSEYGFGANAQLRSDEFVVSLGR